VSPADVYFNKTYIHETFFTLSLVGMTFAMLEAAGVRPIGARAEPPAEGDSPGEPATPTPYRWAAPAFYLFLVLGFLNKETAAFHVIAFGAALAAGWFAASRSGGAEPFAIGPFFGVGDRRRLTIGLGVGFALWLLFFSSFFTNPRGLFDFFAAYLPWFQTGVEKPAHVKAWPYFFKLIGEYYWPALPFAAWALIRAAWKRRPSVVALSVVALLIQGVYSVIPYKTPWCIISIGVAWTMLGAAGFGDLWETLPGRLPRAVLALLALGALGYFGWFSYQLNSIEYDYNHNRKEEPTRDIVYVQTQREYEELYDDLAKIAEVSGQDERLSILVSAGSKNPGRYYLRGYKKVHVVFTALPKTIRDAVVIVRDNEAKRYAERYEGEYFAFDSYPVFPGWNVRLMVREELWQKLQAAGLVKTPPPDPS
jgi:hypothetical protein